MPVGWISQQDAEQQSNDGKNHNGLECKGDAVMIGEDPQQRHTDPAGADSKPHHETGGDPQILWQQLLGHDDGHRKGGDDDHPGNSQDNEQ